MFGNLRQVNQTELVLTCHEVDCRCPAPPAKAHGGGSWRSGPAATGLPWSESAKRCFSSARTVIADIAIAAPHAASKPASNSGDAPTADTNGARKAGLIIATGSGNTGAAGGLQLARDGSRFPFDHFPGIIRMWTGTDAVDRYTPVAHRPRRRKTVGLVAALPDLRPLRTFHRSISTHSTKKVSPSHDQSGNPRADSPLLLCRTLEDRHDCQ